MIKDSKSRKKFEQTSFDNTVENMLKFIRYVKKRYRKNACDIQVHCKLLDLTARPTRTVRIDTRIVHSAKTTAIAQVKIKNDKVTSEMLADLLRAVSYTNCMCLINTIGTCAT